MTDVRTGRDRILSSTPALSLVFLLIGCIAAEEPVSDPELREVLGIEPDVPIHRVDLSGRGATTRLLPPRVEVGPGHVVQFVTLDRRVHHIRFVSDSLSPQAADFLQRTRQEESPPLVRRGSRFVVSFEGAPEGVYPFVVEGHGDPVRGRVRVLEP